MSMSKLNKLLLASIIFAMYFTFNLSVDAADCSKYACAKCVYSDDNVKITYDLQSSGDGSADLSYSINKKKECTEQEISMHWCTSYEMSQSLVARNFINSENKLICPSNLYIATTAGGTASSASKRMVDVSAKKLDGYKSISLDNSESTNNDLLVGESTSKSCSYDASYGNSTSKVKVTATVVNDSLKFEFDNDKFKMQKVEVSADDFKGSTCPSVVLTCGCNNNDCFCSMTKSDGSYLDERNTKTGAEEVTGGETTIITAITCPVGYDVEKGQCVPTSYVADDACNENSIKVVLRVFGYILLIARIIVPLIIIGFGTIDLYKSVVDKDEKSLGKQVKRLGIRVLAGLLVFFVPNIVSVFFSLSDKLNIMETDQYKTCSNCLLKPNSCEVEDINKIDEDTNGSSNNTNN